MIQDGKTYPVEAELRIHHLKNETYKAYDNVADLAVLFVHLSSEADNNERITSPPAHDLYYEITCYGLVKNQELMTMFNQWHPVRRGLTPKRRDFADEQLKEVLVEWLYLGSSLYRCGDNMELLNHKDTMTYIRLIRDVAGYARDKTRIMRHLLGSPKKWDRKMKEKRDERKR